ncbi:MULTISPECIES: cyclic dehypoxanthinyl futalosine synthase [Thermoactinomyces]|jgi:cyclic dehypoxanthinyl futalosine synthase|uniref:Cyclic dehypoxanthine futalosine synthase n=1 Tax=Thermoactinomyces daqus TaxID=1329516 RepID=A0A7W2AHC2_9BACL|nr:MULTISPECIES: cyclic dehypoxanthinyl futalosine synthase [Thermoactinomyces]MBA4541559.1 dehypoxanthine futalosine cyclase [Thermoactinomyces daqus]MBH8597555.1 dehypoxanthine futalosine cyclase [Thermoactinomyces sp. CICC 10523]MBH8603896.1 dehypoxanthine futalosine cyclase [Thermoactinomyces sp. CICC 10522]MBH8606571.1 dehypoxanthine futalosine cyclase [Thermoactinomyces sp. CICC 10521]
MTKIDSILERALAGERLGLEDGIALWESDEIEKMGRAADQIMKKWHPEPVTTFVIGRNINYSNVCDTYCRFCAFYRAPGSPEGYVLPNETIFQKIQETVDVGGTEILMQGGTNPDLPFEYYTDLLREIKKRFPGITMHSFSPAEILKMKEVSGLSLEEVIRQLKEAGLDSLPGGGAEILDDEIRRKISRLKGSWRDWMDVMQTAHRVGMHTTATMVIGFGETYEHRINHLLRIREAQDETKGFLAFIVWTFQPDHTNLKREKLPPEEYLKAVAIARLMLDNIPNFQSSWVTMGPEIGKLSLQYGCNDFGSTMIEENVVSAAGTTHKVNTNLILRLIREAGKIPAQRNTKYQILHVFGENETAARDFVMQN